MKDENRFDDLIKKYATLHRLPWLLIKAQIWAESNFDPNAVSPCGAKGLMQLMPGTAREMFTAEFERQYDEYDAEKPFDPEVNIDLGVKYDRFLYGRFPEIPLADERMKFMLAAYNCGRAYINQALRLAREVEFGFQPKVLPPGEWQTWEYSCTFLSVPLCEVKGKRPDYRQVWKYVLRVWTKYLQLRNAE
jgi:membrane-bound lytic murein transglycosylase F